MYFASLLSVIDVLKVIILGDAFLISISKYISSHVFAVSKLSNYL